jgi:aminocarboxymuconate-semialdehyde decarboxylase
MSGRTRWPGCAATARSDRPEAPPLCLKRVYFDTIAFTPHQQDAQAALFGADGLLIGTDDPFDMGESDPIGHLASAGTLNAAARAAITGDNARRLFGL